MNKLYLLNFSIQKLALVISLALGLSSATTVNAVTLYKWVDAEGNVSYQDQPPPVGLKFEEKNFSDEGVRTGGNNNEIALERAIRNQPITVYVTEKCDSCELVDMILESNNVPYEAIEVDTDPEAQKKLKELIGVMRVPTITVGNDVLPGFDRATIENALKGAGYPASQFAVQ